MTHLEAVAAVGVAIELCCRLEDAAHGARLVEGRFERLALLVDPDLTRLAAALQALPLT